MQPLLPIYSVADTAPPYNVHYVCDGCKVVCRQFTMCDFGDPDYYTMMCNGCVKQRRGRLQWTNAIVVKFTIEHHWYYTIGFDNIVKEIIESYNRGDDGNGRYVLIQLLLKLKHYRQI